jgi:hypothetical protein
MAASERALVIVESRNLPITTQPGTLAQVRTNGTIEDNTRKVPPSGLAIGSERRGNQLMTIEGSGKVVVKSKYGKTRPLTEDGKFGDRKPPEGPKPPAALKVL